MPIYEYRCPEGHTVEHMCRISQRPETLDCASHGLPMTRIVSLPAPSHGCDTPIRPSKNWTDAERDQKHAPPPLAVFDYVCTEEACKHGFDALNDFTIGEKPETPRPCPKCGHPSTLGMVVSHIDGTMVMYPYYDKGLDRWFQSAQERRAYCKENGLIPVEGDFDLHAQMEEKFGERRKEAAKYDEAMARMQDDPSFEAYKKDYKERRGVDFSYSPLR